MSINLNQNYLYKVFNPEIEILSKQGAVRVSIDSYPDMRSYICSIIISCRGYENYTIENMQKEYEMWLKDFPTYIADEDEGVKYYYFYEYDVTSKNHFDSLEEAKQESERRKLEIKDYTFEKWAIRCNKQEDITFLKQGGKIYSIIRYASRVAIAGDFPNDMGKIVEANIRRQFIKLIRTASEHFIKDESILSPIIEESKKNGRFPARILISN